MSDFSLSILIKDGSHSPSSCKLKKAVKKAVSIRRRETEATEDSPTGRLNAMPSDFNLHPRFAVGGLERKCMMNFQRATKTCC